MHIPEKHHQAMKALELGQRLTSNQRFYRYEDYRMNHLFEYLGENNDRTQFCHPGILSLIEYDKNNNGALLETLRCYVANKMSPTKTATALFLHRNSLNHRLKRIEELGGLSLNESEDIFQIILSLKLLSEIE
jgi:DNA-binding PucR family transcriptional regulator